MLIYNTTYHVEEGEDKNFLIWMQEHYLPEVEKNDSVSTAFKQKAERTIPVEDIGVLLLDHRQITITHASLASRARSETERGITEYL